MNNPKSSGTEQPFTGWRLPEQSVTLYVASTCFVYIACGLAYLPDSLISQTQLFVHTPQGGFATGEGNIFMSDAGINNDATAHGCRC